MTVVMTADCLALFQELRIASNRPQGKKENWYEVGSIISIVEIRKLQHRS